MDIIETAQDKMNKTIAVLNRDLGSLRAGRANPKLLDRIMWTITARPLPLTKWAPSAHPNRVFLLSRCGMLQ